MKKSLVLLLLFSCTSQGIVLEDQEITTTTEPSIKEEIFCKEYSAEYDYQFFFETKQLELKLKNPPEYYGIERLNLRFEIIYGNFVPTLGHELHFDNYVKLDIKKKYFLTTIPYNMPEGTFINDAISLKIQLLPLFADKEMCNIELIPNLNTTLLEKSSDYFIKIPRDKVMVRFVSDPNVFTVDTLNQAKARNEKIDNLIELAGKELREVTPEGLFLASHDFIEEEWRWEYKGLTRAVGPVRIGLYTSTYFPTNEIWLYATILDMIKVVVPNLDIKFAAHESEVTLAVHFAECPFDTALLEKFDSCTKDNAAGLHFPSGRYEGLPKRNHGWIWVDSSMNLEKKRNVFVHELGHALGLRHSSCLNSTMFPVIVGNDTYAEFFKKIDYMTLATLYNNDYEFKPDTRNPTREKFNPKFEMGTDFSEFDTESSSSCDADLQKFNVNEVINSIYLEASK